MEQCVFCGKEATKLCDFPLGYTKFAGHTPKSLCVYDVDKNEISSDILTRCSRPICDDCATEWNGMDFCPHCISRDMKDIIIKRENQKAEQRREREKWATRHRKK